MFGFGFTMVTVFVESITKIGNPDWFGPYYKLHIEFNDMGTTVKKGSVAAGGVGSLCGIQDGCAFPSDSVLWITLTLNDDQGAFGAGELPVSIISDANTLPLEVEGVATANPARVGFFDKVLDNWIVTNLPIKEDSDGFWAGRTVRGTGERCARITLKVCIQSDLQNQTWLRWRTYGEYLALFHGLSGAWLGDWTNQWNQHAQQMKDLLLPLFKLGFAFGGVAPERISAVASEKLGVRDSQDLEAWIKALQGFADQAEKGSFTIPDLAGEAPAHLMRVWQGYLEKGGVLKEETGNLLRYLKNFVQSDIKNDHLASLAEGLGEQISKLDALANLLNEDIMAPLNRILPDLEGDSNLSELKPAAEYLIKVLDRFGGLLREDKRYVKSTWELFKLEVESTFPEDNASLQMDSNQVLAEVSFTQAIDSVEGSKIKVTPEGGAPFAEGGKLKIPLSLQSETTYQITIEPGAVAAGGLSNLYSHSFSFTTATLITPEVASTTPADNTRVPMIEYQILAEVSFTQAIDSVEGSKIKVTPEGGAPFAEGGKLKIPLSLQSETTYQITIEPGAVAAGGLSNLYSHSFSFTTGNFMRLISTNPPSGATDVPAELILGRHAGITVTCDQPLAEFDPSKIRIDERNAFGSWTLTAPANLRIENGKLIFTLPGSRLPDLGELVAVRLDRGAVRDESNNINEALWFFFYVEDLLVAEISPAPNEEDVPVNSSITVTFNKAISQGSGFSNIALLSGQHPPQLREGEWTRVDGKVLVVSEVRKNKLVVTPGNALANGYYYQLTIPANALRIEGFSGIPTKDYNTSFRAAVPPSVRNTSQTPIYADEPIVVQFSKPVKKGSGEVFVFKDISAMWGVEIAYAADKVIIRPPYSPTVGCSYWGDMGDIQRQTPYNLIIRKGAATDLKGNPLENGYSFAFRIKNTPISIASTTPQNGEAGVQPDIKSLRLRFDRPVMGSSKFIAITLKDEESNSVPVEASLVEPCLEVVKEPSPELLISLKGQLRENIQYTLTVPADAIKGCVPGIEFGSELTIQFKTGLAAQPAPEPEIAETPETATQSK